MCVGLNTASVPIFIIGIVQLYVIVMFFFEIYCLYLLSPHCRTIHHASLVYELHVVSIL